MAGVLHRRRTRTSRAFTMLHLELRSSLGSGTGFVFRRSIRCDRVRAILSLPGRSGVVQGAVLIHTYGRGTPDPRVAVPVLAAEICGMVGVGGLAVVGVYENVGHGRGQEVEEESGKDLRA